MSDNKNVNNDMYMELSDDDLESVNGGIRRLEQFGKMLGKKEANDSEADKLNGKIVSGGSGTMMC